MYCYIFDKYPTETLFSLVCIIFVKLQVQEYDFNGDGKIDLFDFKFHLNIPQTRTITSIMLILILDFQLKVFSLLFEIYDLEIWLQYTYFYYLQTVCPLHMQSLAMISKDFVIPPSGFKYFGDLQFYQISHLACKHNIIHTKYNSSIFNYNKNSRDNAIDFIMENYFMREGKIYKIILDHFIFQQSANPITLYNLGILTET